MTHTDRLMVCSNPPSAVRLPWLPDLRGNVPAEFRLAGRPSASNEAEPAKEPDIMAANNSQLARRLAESDLFRKFQQAFEISTGLPLALRGVESWGLAHVKSSKRNAFCALISPGTRACAACLQLQQSICDGAADGPCTKNCALGLAESAVAVKVGKRVVAYLQTGQVRLAASTKQQIQGVLQRLMSLNEAVNPKAAAEAYEATPVVKRAEYLARVRLLEFFADQLATSAQQMMIQESTKEPKQITMARRYVQDNYREELSLGVVAHHVGMSRFYFSKRFKLSTGISYSRYVTLVRIDKAKNLLLNHNYRISEIAFEVGFESLTHFNRQFKSVVGLSPTEFRQHLPPV